MIDNFVSFLLMTFIWITIILGLAVSTMLILDTWVIEKRCADCQKILDDK